MRELNGLPTKKKLEKLGFSQEMIELISKKKQELTIPLIPEMIRPIPAVLETLQKVRELGLHFAVCSNSIRKTTEMMMEAIGVHDFAFLISNEDVKHPKPHPEMYTKAMQKFGLQASEVLIIEDSPIGLEAAYQSGAHVCPIKNPYDIKKLMEALHEGYYPVSRQR